MIGQPNRNGWSGLSELMIRINRYHWSATL